MVMSPPTRDGDGDSIDLTVQPVAETTAHDTRYEETVLCTVSTVWTTLYLLAKPPTQSESPRLLQWSNNLSKTPLPTPVDSPREAQPAF